MRFAFSKELNDEVAMSYNKYLIILFAFICLWCAGIISPILFHNEKVFWIIQPLLNQVYGTVCHQNHEKTLSLNGNYIFVCSRCFGIYLGVFTVSALSFLIKFKNQSTAISFLIFTFAFLILDVTFSSLNIYNYSKVAALITGLLFGASTLYFTLSEFLKSNHIKYEK